MINLKFDIGIRCFFGYSINLTLMIYAYSDVIVFDENWNAITAQINEISILSKNWAEEF